MHHNEIHGPFGFHDLTKTIKQIDVGKVLTSPELGGGGGQ